MNAPRALAGKHPPAHFQGQAHFLVVGLGYVEILQKHPAAFAGFDFRSEEGRQIVPAQGVHRPGHPLIFVHKVERPQQRPVRHLIFQLRQLFHQFFPGHALEHFPAQGRGHRLHFGGNGGVIRREIAVLAAGADHAQVVALFAEIILERLHHGGIGAEIDGHQPAHGRGHLIHQAAGLAEEHVFGIL